MNLYPWVVFAHVLGAFAFAAGHGVSAAVAFRVRRETDPSRISALLDLSAWSLTTAGLGLLVLLVAGIAAGIMGGFFGQLWPWLSLVLLVAVGGAMTPIGSAYFGRLRQAVGQPRGLKPGDPVPPRVSAEELAELFRSRRPEALAVIGGGGFVVLLGLMVLKPF